MNKQGTISTAGIVITIAMLMMLSVGVSFAFAAEVETPIVGIPSITESEALKVANQTYKGSGVFTDIELEMEGTTLVFAVEYTEKDGNEVDVKVSAKTGTVVLVESDKDEAVDDDADDADKDEGSRQITNMQTLINLLQQLVTLLRQKGA